MHRLASVTAWAALAALTAWGTPALAQPRAVLVSCVGQHALLAQHRALLLTAQDTAATDSQQALQAQAQALGVREPELAQLRQSVAAQAAQLADPELTDDATKQLARELFAQCLRQREPQLADAVLERCEGDLYALPVVLLYRAERLPKREAQADLQRPENQGEDADTRQRTRRMLDFAYQGSGPRPGQEHSWLHERLSDWTAQCLRQSAPATTISEQRR
ncbi:hypothetical protein ACG0Z6_15370 [Roseateles sp. BYS180W]|uniref:Uncharacterized protein n=1 Tax=Roseateles rivi TaxID=3299028 RepID=A0ABW7FZ64_9BURK